jgi:hypothetical protein
MKGITFAVAFILTAGIVIVGAVIYPHALGQAASYNSQYVFGLFLVPFFILLSFGWIVEKIVLKTRKKKLQIY